MQKNGIKVIKPDRAAFVAKAQKVHDRFSVLVGPQLLKEVKAAQ
jgi:TRAP-type C4-dicarboxylate transport system substrate-binding protein